MTTQTTNPRGYLALVLERDRLVERLEDGARKIEAGKATGQDVEAWETFWIKLLREYERLDDELLAAGPVQAPLFETTGRLP